MAKHIFHAFLMTLLKNAGGMGVCDEFNFVRKNTSRGEG